MNVKGIFGSRLIEEQMCGNMTGILLRISASNAYLSSCLRKRFRRPYLKTFKVSQRLDPSMLERVLIEISDIPSRDVRYSGDHIE